MHSRMRSKRGEPKYSLDAIINTYNSTDHFIKMPECGIKIALNTSAS